MKNPKKTMKNVLPDRTKRTLEGKDRKKLMKESIGKVISG
jgi:hypothetical protein